MIDILIVVGHWCVSCVPASTGVAPALGALGGAAAAAGGISGLGDLASDGAGAGSTAAGGPDSNVPGIFPTPLPLPPDEPPAIGPAPTAEGPEEEPTGPPTGPFESPGMLDYMLGLNPETSFVQSGMDALGYGPTGVFGRPIAPGDSDLTTLGRALGAAAVSPIAGLTAVVGHGLDELSHGSDITLAGKSVSEQLNDTPPNPPPDPPPDTPPDTPPDPPLDPPDDPP